MWNTYLFGILTIVVLSQVCIGDVSEGYRKHRPDNPLELPISASEGSTAISGYPKEVPENPLQIPEGTGNLYEKIPPDSATEGATGVGVQTQLPNDNSHHEHHHHYHGEDGKYNPHDDGRGWDIRKSIPGEPDLDYPTYDTVPSTSFSCAAKAPGYYADKDARCQVFRVCTTGSVNSFNSFLCPNGSLFNQAVLTCDWWMNVDCQGSEKYYYKNNEIGKMPEGNQLMQEINKMLEAPKYRPFNVKQDQFKYTDKTIDDNQIQGTGDIPELYLPPKHVLTITTTTRKYYTPTVPSTTPKFLITATEESSYKSQLPIVTQGPKTEYIPPLTQSTSQINPANIKPEYGPPKVDTSQIGQTPTAGQTYHYPKPSITVTKEHTQTVTHSEKTTKIDHDGERGPQKISLLGQTNQHTGTQTHTLSDGQSLTSIDNRLKNSGTAQNGVSQGIEKVQQSGEQSQIFSSENTKQGDVLSTVPALQSLTGGGLIPSDIGITEISKDQAIQEIDKIKSELDKIPKQEVNFGQGKFDIRFNQQGIPITTPHGFGTQQTNFEASRNFGQTLQQTVPSSNTVTDLSFFPTPKSFELQTFPPITKIQNLGSQNKDFQYQGFQNTGLQNQGLQISGIQGGLQGQGFQIAGLQNQGLQTAGLQNQGPQTTGLQYQGFQNLPGLSFQNQGLQNGFTNVQGLSGINPNYQEQNYQNYNYHLENNGQNVNYEISKNGASHNFQGESLTQHAGGQTHSSYSGQNLAYKESTKVEIIPSLGFTLTEESGRENYVSAILNGLIQDKTNLQTSPNEVSAASAFPTTDVRFSSYQGPSSYLVPQGSVLQLPSDSSDHPGYKR